MSEAGAEVQQIETVHGPVEYETTVCDNCGQDYVPGEVVTAVFGEVEGSWDSGSSYDTHIGVSKVGGGVPEPLIYCKSCAENVGYDGAVGVSDPGSVTTPNWKLIARVLAAAEVVTLLVVAVAILFGI